MERKGRFANWTMKDWCIEIVFILIGIAFLFGTIHDMRAGWYFRAFLFFICAILLLFLVLIPFFSKQLPSIEKKAFPMRISLPESKEKFIDLVKLLTRNDETMITMISECLENPEYFLQKIETLKKEESEKDWEEKFQDLYEEYEEYKDYAKDTKELFLQGALLLLSNHHFLARYDWKTDKESFINLMEDLNIVKEKQLTWKEEELSETGDVKLWCSQLDELWKEAGYHTLLLDNDSDEYLVGIQKIICFDSSVYKKE
ncbi:MAG TPA: hypothetical protein VIG61_03430 [Fusobacterium sp.]|uniref:DUF6630 family protein n=1 Tax=Fusobacterium sp. TaxID=68766 RepID=UPI002F412377